MPSRGLRAPSSTRAPERCSSRTGRWDNAATVKLITTAIGKLARDKSLGRTESLRRAMLSVMEDTSRPPNWVPTSHPSVWAPFVIVGER